MGKRDGNGRTPLDYAAGSSREAGVIEILMKKRGDSHATDEIGTDSLALGSTGEELSCSQGLGSDRWRGVPSLDLYETRESREVHQMRASTLYRYLRALNSSSGLNTELFGTLRLGRRYTSQDSGIAIAWVLVLIVMVLLGLPDQKEIAASQK